MVPALLSLYHPSISTGDDLMNTKIAVLLMAGLFCASAAHAQDKKAAEKTVAPAAEKKISPQQEKMSSCNKDAREKKLAGPEREKFMKGCLGAKPAASSAEETKKTPQQKKMANCNKDAKEKNLSGPDRKAFMSTCLKG
jgi:hypothetical protein